MSGPPYKCPECGIWWVGLEHRCRFVPPQTDTAPPFPTTDRNTYTVVCICDRKRGSVPETVVCPVHDVQVTFTAYREDTDAG